MLDFFDALQISLMMGIHEYYKEKEQRKRRLNIFQQNCLEKLAEESSKMCDIITNAVLSQYADGNVPVAIGNGIYDLPFSAMLEVAKRQGSISKKQDQALDLYFRNLRPNYTKADFMSAYKGLGNLNSTLSKSVGLVDGQLGEFWQYFFAVIRKEGVKPNTLGKLIDCYTNIVLNYAYMSGTDSQIICNSIVKKFVNDISIQFEKNYHNNTVPDFIEEKTFLEHKKLFEQNAYTLILKSGDANELDMDEMLQSMYMTSLYNYVERTREPIHIKAEILDKMYLFANLSKEDGADGYKLYKELESNFDLKNFYDIFPAQFISVICIMGEKANIDPTICLREFVDFMIGIEKKINNQYHSKFNGIAANYCSDLISEYLGN